MVSKLGLAALFCASFATATFADGVRYKDRLFEVSEARTVTVAENVPFLTHTIETEYDNYCTLTQLIMMGRVLGMDVPMMYFYLDEEFEESPLKMDIFEPKDDDAEKRAVVLVSHGGAFVAGEYDDRTSKAVAYVDSLAARGFVTASLDYRLGVLMEVINNKDAGLSTETYDNTAIIDSVDFSRTVYRAMQDINAAVRYLRVHAEELRIDPNKIFVVGNSAGGMMALENIYGQKRSDYPVYINPEDRDYVELGELDEYGVKEEGVDGIANGVVALWGAVHDKEIVKNSKVPVFLAHGDSDYVMPFAEGYAVTDARRMVGDNPALSRMDFQIHTPTLYGSYIIDSILTENKVYHEFYAPRGQELKHEFYNTTRIDELGNEIVYADSVREKAFAFLYMLAIDSIPSVEEHTTPLPVLAMAKPSKVAMGEGNLSFTVVDGENVAYALFDLKGKRLLSGRASMGESVLLDGVNNGVYYLRIQGEAARRIVLRR